MVPILKLINNYKMSVVLQFNIRHFDLREEPSSQNQLHVFASRPTKAPLRIRSPGTAVLDTGQVFVIAVELAGIHYIAHGIGIISLLIYQANLKMPNINLKNKY